MPGYCLALSHWSEGGEFVGADSQKIGNCRCHRSLSTPREWHAGTTSTPANAAADQSCYGARLRFAPAFIAVVIIPSVTLAYSAVLTCEKNAALEPGC